MEPYVDNDNLYSIMLHMNVNDLIKICGTKKGLCDNPYFWQNKLRYDNLPIVEPYTLRNYKKQLADKIELSVKKYMTYDTINIDITKEMLAFIPNKMLMKIEQNHIIKNLTNISINIGRSNYTPSSISVTFYDNGTNYDYSGYGDDGLLYNDLKQLLTNILLNCPGCMISGY